MENLLTSTVHSTIDAMRLFDYCERNARDSKNSVCFVKRIDEDSTRNWTWNDLYREVVVVVDLLREWQIGPQSRIVNLTANSLEWILLELACSCLNVVHVPIDPRLPQDQVLDIVREVEPRFALVSHEGDFQCTLKPIQCFEPNRLRELIDRRAPAANSHAYNSVAKSSPNDVANILYTSGTTSKPKGVMLSHRNLVSNAIAKLDAMPQFANDHRLNLLPFSHAYAKTCELATWLISASSLEIAPNSQELFRLFSIARPTLFNGVPILFKRIHAEWLKRGGRLDALQEITGGRVRQFASGGAPIHDELRAAFEQSGMPIYQGYGLTEAGPVVCSNRSGAQGAGMDRCLVGVGPAVKGVEVKIDENRRLWVRGDGVMLGYWQDPIETSNRIQNGWLDTGDVAECDETQNVRILGRSDDTIVLDNGYKIDPLGIEQLICQRQGVKDCALVPNEQFGYDIVLLLDEPNAETNETDLRDELQDLLRRHLPVLPRRVVTTIEDWTEANGLRNFKGAKNRINLKRWVAGNLGDS